ncbi:Hypothetical protein R9X50_00080200 [Acrodontium crateriforme]|uniref:Pyridoxamine 5'-phosphate oxidase putative domain-containing protein n=1 Tax=Acrodontium crateriforme TaxID=150365 RepID=A0AAQ3R584_9PEZI|nr:Hypothetical protein R9X50_00080200 [Acrodontium crateriforme]
MGAFYETIPQPTIKWILEQAMFWVATAPLGGRGHVNVSPKGGKYFGVLDERTFYYMDLTGSGNETISHLLEPGNGRITIMFNAYDGPPKIVRLWGKGRVLEVGTPAFDAFVTDHKVDLLPGTRSIIIVDIHQVGSSCGFSVPYYEFRGHRQILNDYFAKKKAKFDEGKKEESMDRYWAHKNAWSMDGLPGLKRGLIAGKTEKVEPIKKMVGPLAPRNGATRRFELSLVQIMLVVLASMLLGIVIMCGSSGSQNDLRALMHELVANVDFDLAAAKNLTLLNGH